MSVKVKTPEKTPETEAPVPTVPTRETQHPLMTLRQDVDQLFDGFFKGFSFGPFGRAFEVDPFRKMETHLRAPEKMMPKADIVETDKAFVLTAEMPGMAEDDIEVTLTDERLTIKGEKKAEVNEEHDNVHLMERHYGTVIRTFPVPDAVMGDKVDAAFDKGVLTITMPKKKNTTPKTRKIKVKG